MKNLHLFLIVLFFVTTLVGCKKPTDSSVFTGTSRTTQNVSSIRLPDSFDWSRVKYLKRLVTDPNTKEQREVLQEYLKCKGKVPDSIQRLPLKPCEKFTEAEKLLAYGIQNKDTDVLGWDVWSLVISYDRFLRDNGRVPTSIEQMPEYGYLRNSKDLEKFYKLLNLYPEMIGAFSPVTKTPFTFNNKEFVKGQLYIERITDQEFLRKWGKAYEPGTSAEEYERERKKGFDTSRMHIYYYRVYGEDMTIAEGKLDLSGAG